MKKKKKPNRNELAHALVGLLRSIENLDDNIKEVPKEYAQDVIKACRLNVKETKLLQDECYALGL